ncbi:restriction endonuclease subunit S [Coleofasciculus sp. E2-BRE-01]|uniref:restriction endonuclease subunit S n=1 Tax=Coleofasciculus sp. E2-BRE-01 TaxID=3069524 RepID=UPI0032FDCDF0
MSQVIPEGWKLFSIDDFLDFSSLFCDGDWVESKDQDPEGGNRLIQLADIGDGIFLDKSNKYLNDKQFRRLNCTELKEGDILIARMPDPLGRACLFPGLGGGCATVVDVAILRSPTADKHWLMYMINSHVIRRQIESLSAGTTRTRISRKLFCRVLFPTPSISAQKRIADILRAIDRAIAHTEALIEKYQQIKAGLMHDLFTRGIGADGKLRPPRDEAPELYQESAIGWIPKDWVVNLITSCADVIDPNPSHRNPIYHDEGFPFISTVEFDEFDQIQLDTSRRVIEEIVLEQERRCKLSKSSIAFSRKGTIGETRILPSHLRFALLDSLCVINPVNINPSFLFYLLRSHFLKIQIRNMTMGQALPQMSIGRVRELLIPVPQLADEQEKIESKLNSIDEYIFRNGRCLQKLRVKKSGLMHDLLTGKVPVKVHSDEVDHISN